jgi:hypothetical protein
MTPARPATTAAMPNMMVKRRSMLMPSRPTVSRSAMPARTTMPKVVKRRKAKTAPITPSEKRK